MTPSHVCLLLLRYDQWPESPWPADQNWALIAMLHHHVSRVHTCLITTTDLLLINEDWLCLLLASCNVNHSLITNWRKSQRVKVRSNDFAALASGKNEMFLILCVLWLWPAALCFDIEWSWDWWATTRNLSCDCIARCVQTALEIEFWSLVITKYWHLVTNFVIQSKTKDSGQLLKYREVVSKVSKVEIVLIIWLQPTFCQKFWEFTTTWSSHLGNNLLTTRPWDLDFDAGENEENYLFMTR